MCSVFLINKNWKEVYIKSTESKLIVSFITIFLLYAFSYFNSENKLEYWIILKNKILFLCIPLSLVACNTIQKKHLNICLYTIISCALISSFYSYYQYLKNIEWYVNLYSQGEVIPTLIHHVSFSVLLSISILFLLHLIITTNTKIVQFILLILVVWFIYFIHVLSVRSGIVLLYISVLLYAISIMVMYKKRKIAFGLITFIITSASIAYYTIPTIKNKIGYTIYSIDIFKEKKDTTNMVSDTRRILSDKIGFEIVEKNVWFGVGFGDIQNEMNLIYKTRYPTFKKDVYSKIHNQYLYVTSSIGLVGGILFFICLVIPLFILVKNKNVVFAISYLQLLLLMLWESFIENQLGTSIFLVIFCLGFLDKQEQKLQYISSVKE